MFWDLWVWCFLVVGVVYFLIFWYFEVVVGFGCVGFVAFGLGFLFGFVWFGVGCFRLCFGLFVFGFGLFCGGLMLVGCVWYVSLGLFCLVDFYSCGFVCLRSWADCLYCLIVYVWLWFGSCSWGLVCLYGFVFYWFMLLSLVWCVRCFCCDCVCFVGFDLFCLLVSWVCGLLWV